ncbi:MAG: ChbG/HpnK family deacetylase [Bryobacteraceae bacterium]
MLPELAIQIRKRLIVNADDFGFTADVNEGILEAHTAGILTSTTLMANGEAFDDAVRLAKEHPGLDVGCHLALVGGKSVLAPDRALPATVPQLLGAIVSRRMQIHEELAAQVNRILAAGIRPSHLDTHKHTHLAPPVLDAVARLSEEFRIPWVRRPFDLPRTAARGAAPWLKRATSDGLRFLSARFERVLRSHHCRTTDYFAGFQLTGRFRAAELVRLIRALPPGLTEFMCHPGKCGPALRGARTRLKDSRADELAALVAPEVRRALEVAEIELVNFRIA